MQYFFVDQDNGVTLTLEPLVYPESVPVIKFNAFTLTAKTGMFFERWNHLALTMNADNNIAEYYINGVKAGIVLSTPVRRRSVDRGMLFFLRAVGSKS
jgi:hypothetical protein